MVAINEIAITRRDADKHRAARIATTQRAAGFSPADSRLNATQDANWDTTAVIGYDSTTQTWGVVQRYVYSPYGTITVLNADFTPAAAGTQPLVDNLYQGMTLDAVTGLYDERNRDYSPSLGRWMEQDPAQYINGANTYQFVDSSPVGNVDASGLWYQFSEGGYTFNSNGNPATSSITPSHPVLAPPPSPWLGLPGELPNAITPHNLGVGAEDTAQGVQNGLIGAANLVADVLSPAGISAQLNQLIKAIRGQPLRLSAFFPTLINSPQWDHNNPYNDPTKSVSEMLGSVFGPMAIPVVGELPGDLGAAENPLTGTALARQLGQEGENAAGITAPKVGLMMPSGIRRFPDNFDESANVLTEVKNVKSLSYTQQLRDYAAYAQQNGVTFNLYVRPSTRLSGPLLQAKDAGQIIVNYIPGAE